MIKTLLTEDVICLNLQSKNKADLFREMAQLLFRAGRISDEKQFLQDVLSRESEGNTGFDDGIAIPHAKSAAVIKPAVAIGISRDGIDYGSEDGERSRFIFMIASPASGGDHHIEVLASLSSRFIEDGFTQRLLKAPNANEVIKLLTEEREEQPTSATEQKGFLIGVTGCPAGIAHTYLAAESLEKAAREMGYRIKVETNGSIGVKNSPTAQEIQDADAILVCSDKQVELERFAGKRTYITNVKAPIKSGRDVITNGLSAPLLAKSSVQQKSQSASTHSESAGKNLYRYLMNGVSHMIPFVVTGGLMIALSLTIGGVPTPEGMKIPDGSIWQSVLSVGSVAFQLMIPVLAAYIAFAIGERPALAPGFIGGWIANTGSFYGAAAGTGFIGAIIAGLLVGYVVKWLATRNWHKILQPLVPILIAPLLGTLFISALFIFVIGAPISGMMHSMNNMLVSLSGGSLVLLGIVIGGMAGFDMGGPFNKVAFLFCLGMLGSGHSEYMGAIACAIPVAPLGMGLATFIARKLGIFTPEETEAGKASLAMGLMGISEGAIPFAARDPLSVIPANIVGSMLAAVMAFLFGITNQVAHGGPVVALLGAMNKPVLAFLAMGCGALLTTVVVISIKYIKLKSASAKKERDNLAARQSLTN